MQPFTQPLPIFGEFFNLTTTYDMRSEQFFRSRNLSRNTCLLFWRISESYRYDMLNFNLKVAPLPINLNGAGNLANNMSLSTPVAF